MDASLPDQLYELAKVLNTAGTPAVSQWTLPFLQSAAQRAYVVEMELFEYSEEELTNVHRQLAAKARRDGGKEPPPVCELARTLQSLWRKLLCNVYLPNELLAYLLNTYDRQPDVLTDRKDCIVQDCRSCAKASTGADVLVGVELELLLGIAEMPERAPAVSSNDGGSELYMYSYKLLPSTIERRTAAGLLLKDFIGGFHSGRTQQQLAEELTMLASESADRMEIIIHTLVMAIDRGERDSNLQVPNELCSSLQTWLFSIGTSPQHAELQSYLWSSHPWLLARLSALSPRFFALYRQKLLRATRECQSANELDKAAFKGLLEQWSALRYQPGNITRVVDDVLKQEWVKLKNSMATVTRDPFDTESVRLWEAFFKKLNVVVDG